MTSPPANFPQREPRFPPGLSALAENYDGFILDLWGVIHDGETPYPGAIRCLAELRARGKRTVLLSNAPRRAAVIIAHLTDLGIERGLYGDLVSSGEETHRALMTRDDPWFATLGRACYHLGAARDESVWRGLDLDMVSDLPQATFILNTGPWFDEATVAGFEDVLRAGAALKLPMVCANPDLQVVHRRKLVVCAGSLAARYEELGGEVRYIGKPHEQVYRRCFEILGTSDPRRILAVGDSIRTDIAGAVMLGLDTALITGGLHAEELHNDSSAGLDREKLAELIAARGAVPAFVMPLFAW